MSVDIRVVDIPTTKQKQTKIPETLTFVAEVDDYLSAKHIYTYQKISS